MGRWHKHLYLYIRELMYWILFVYIMGCFQTWCTPTSHNVETKWGSSLTGGFWKKQRNSWIWPRGHIKQTFFKFEPEFIDSKPWWILIGNEFTKIFVQSFLFANLYEWDDSLVESSICKETVWGAVAHWIKAARDIGHIIDLDLTSDFLRIKCLQHITLLVTNSWPLEKRAIRKRKFIFQPLILRGYVSFREGKHHVSYYTSWLRLVTYSHKKNTPFEDCWPSG